MFIILPLILFFQTVTTYCALQTQNIGKISISYLVEAHAGVQCLAHLMTSCLGVPLRTSPCRPPSHHPKHLAVRSIDLQMPQPVLTSSWHPSLWVFSQTNTEEYKKPFGGVLRASISGVGIYGQFKK